MGNGLVGEAEVGANLEQASRVPVGDRVGSAGLERAWGTSSTPGMVGEQPQQLAADPERGPDGRRRDRRPAWAADTARERLTQLGEGL